MTGASTSSALPGLSPVGTVLGPGSTTLQMTERETQVALLVACGRSYKRINSELGIANSGHVIAKIAARIPGEGNPRQKVSAWIWVYGTSALS